MYFIREKSMEKIPKNYILITFYKSMNKCKYNYSQLGSNETKISEDIYVLGATTSTKTDISFYSVLITACFGLPQSTKIQEFHGIKPSNEIFHAKSYRVVSKRESTVVYAKVLSGDMKFG